MLHPVECYCRAPVQCWDTYSFVVITKQLIDYLTNCSHSDKVTSGSAITERPRYMVGQFGVRNNTFRLTVVTSLCRKLSSSEVRYTAVLRF